MQQYSSLPEHNSQLDGMSKLLQTPQQLRENLWLEGSLNQLQSHLHDLLISACNLNEVISTEVALMQAIVNEVTTALNRSTSELIDYAVGIAQCQPDEKVSKICYFGSLSTTDKSKNHLLVKSNLWHKSGLKLNAEIAILIS
ncbi:MAG: two-component hybrid sensor and regulator [Sphaerospermopsis sp. SIO1G1]|nr:two-component hybrid sensor and regulator [Sphaerospermopsis sp. SIO1G1]